MNLKQDIFNYCLCAEEPFELEKFLEVLHSYGIHNKVNFSSGLILRTLNDDGNTSYSYFHSSHNNAVMLSEVVRICSDADVMKFKDLFDEKGYLLITTHNKPSSKEVVECLANVTFYITKLNDTPKLLDTHQ